MTTTIETMDIEREEIVRQVSEAVIGRLMTEIQTILESKFVTRGEVEKTLLDSLTRQANERFDKMDKDGEKRHDEFVRHYESRLETLATKDELAGVISASAETVQRLTKLEATNDTRLAALEKRADRTEDIQKKQTESIESIKQDTHTIEQSASSMSRDFTEALARDEKRQKDVDRQIDALKIDASHTVNDVREMQQQVIRHHNILADQRTWIIEKLTPMELVIMGDKESGTAGIAAEIKDVKERQLVLDNGLSTFTKFINNRIGQAFILIFMAGNIISFFAQLANQH